MGPNCLMSSRNVRVRAMSSRTGPLYNAFLLRVRQLNPALSEAEILDGLGELLGPRSPEECCRSRPAIPNMPDGVSDGTRMVAVFETHPAFIFEYWIRDIAMRKSHRDLFGSAEAYLVWRRAYVAEGNNGKNLDDFLVLTVRKMREQNVARARRAERNFKLRATMNKLSPWILAAAVIGMIIAAIVTR